MTVTVTVTATATGTVKMTRMATYAEAMALVQGLQARDAADPRVNPRCAPQVMTHGRQVERAVVFLHGITNSPPQFQALGQLFHERGYNVFIPRLPYHGYRDRLTTAHARLTVADYLAFTNEAVTAARGLGQRLAVVGLSVSGVLAGWCAQHRADVDQAVLLAPSFAPLRVPLALTPPLTRLVARLPNAFIWWDPRHRARLGPETVYPRFSTHALAESFRIGSALFEQARVRRPLAGSILCVTNAHDPAVNNAATAAVGRRWRAWGAGSVRGHELRGIPPLHDFISEHQHGARTDLVYPALLDLIDVAPPRAAAEAPAFP